MKKYTKFIGIVLCLAMIIGILPIVAAADTEIPSWLAAIDAADITPYIGCYTEDPANLGHLNDGEAECLIDGDLTGNGSAWVECTDGCAPVVALLELNAATNIGGVAITRPNANQYITVFNIDVLDTTGTWQNVETVTANPYTDSNTVLYTFDEYINGTAVRIVIEDYVGDTAIIAEVALYEGIAPIPQETAPTQPETTQPTMPEGTAVPEAPVVSVGATTIENGVIIEGEVYKFVPKSAISAGFGYYNANGTFIDPKNGDEADCVIDGWYGRSGYSECTTSQGQMALILTLDEPMLIGAMDVCPRGGYPNNVPVSFEIQVMIDGNWVTAVSVTENAFTTDYTARYTFTPVETNQVRMLIHSVAGGASTQCYLEEIELYEVTTGKLYNDIDLVGKVTESNAFGSYPASNLTDGDKTSNTTGSNYTINLTDAEGNPTSIDGFRMYFHRGNAAIAQNASILIQKTAGGDFESLGAFPTGWSSGDPRENCVVEFDQTYVAYALKLNLDTNSPNHEFELFQYQKDEAPEGPEQPTDPTTPVETDPTTPVETDPTTPVETDPTTPVETDPTTPVETDPTTPVETDPTTPVETDPTTPVETDPTEPEDIYDQFDMTELEATFALIDTLDVEGYTEESLEELVYAIEIAFLVLMDENLTQEMIDEVNAMLLEAIDNLEPLEPGTETPDLPDVPALPSTDALFATISTITNLNPSEYTAESYAALIEAVDIVNAMIVEAGGAYTQAMLDEANAILTEALAGLVKIGGETPGGETPDDEIPSGDGFGDEDDLPSDTGDVAMIILSGMMTLSAVGGAAVIGKKKFF